MTSPDVAAGGNLHTSRIIHRQWLTKDTFTLALERPPDFQFQAGQRIRLLIGGKHRDYSLIPGDTPAELILLIRWMDSGVVSTHLSRCPLANFSEFLRTQRSFYLSPLLAAGDIYRHRHRDCALRRHVPGRRARVCSAPRGAGCWRALLSGSYGTRRRTLHSLPNGRNAVPAIRGLPGPCHHVFATTMARGRI